MTSWLAVGAAQDGVMPILIPAYVLALTDSAATVGVVMGVIMLAGGLGPVVGRLADRYRAHRAVLVLGCAGLALACAAYGASSESEAILVADAVLLGVGIAAVSTVAPVFVVSAGLAPELEAQRLTALNIAQPVGQTVLGAILAAAATADVSFADRFYICAAILAALVLVVWVTSARPAREIRTPAAPDEGDSEPAAKRARVLTPRFALILGITFMTSLAYMGIVNQISNILPKVYGFSESQTATVVSVAGIAAIVFFFVAGRMLRRSDAGKTTATGVVLRLAAALGLALAGALLESPLLLAAVLVQILYVSNSYVDLAVYPLGVRAASVPASEASGWVLGAIAVSGAAGSVLGGVLAGELGYNAINWMAAAAAAGAVLLLVGATRSDAHATPSQ